MAAITEDMQIEQNEVANEALVGPFPNREQYAVHLRHMNFGFLGKEVRADGASCRGRGREEGRRGGDGSGASTFCGCTWRAERGVVTERGCAGGRVLCRSPRN